MCRETTVWSARSVALSEGLSVSIATASSAMLVLAPALNLVGHWTAAPRPAPDFFTTKAEIRVWKSSALLSHRRGCGLEIVAAPIRLPSQLHSRDADDVLLLALATEAEQGKRAVTRRRRQRRLWVSTREHGGREYVGARKRRRNEYTDEGLFSLNSLHSVALRTSAFFICRSEIPGEALLA